MYAWVLSRLGLKRDLTDMACTVDVAGIPQIGSGKFVVTSPSGTSTTLDPFESSGVRGWGSYRIYPYIFARASNSYDIIFGLGISDIIPLNMTAKTQTVTYNGETWTVDAFTGATVNTRLANMTDIPAAAADTPAMDGKGTPGTSAAFARGDHVHPSDTSKLGKSGGTADNLLICGTNKAIKFNDDILYIYSKINDAWVTQNVWDLRTSQDGVVAFLSDIYTAVQQIAPEWVSGKAYTAKMLVTYNGVVYRCKADTVSPHTATPNVDTTHWEAKPISDLFVPLTGGTMTGRLDIEHLNSTGEVYFLAFAAGNIPLTLLLGFDDSRYFFLQNSAKVYLPVHDGTIALTAGTGHKGNLASLDANGNPTDSQIPSANVALKSNIPYVLVAKAIDNGAVALDDRAINAVAVSSSLASLTVNFPTATSGKVRDFGLRLTVASGITTAPQIVLPQGVTCENADGEAPEIGADGAATILYFTETASGVFLVKGEVLQTITA